MWTLISLHLCSIYRYAAHKLNHSQSHTKIYFTNSRYASLYLSFYMEMKWNILRSWNGHPDVLQNWEASGLWKQDETEKAPFQNGEKKPCVLVNGNSVWEIRLWKRILSSCSASCVWEYSARNPKYSVWFVFGSEGINEQDWICGTAERWRGDGPALPLVPPWAGKGEVVAVLPP